MVFEASFEEASMVHFLLLMRIFSMMGGHF